MLISEFPMLAVYGYRAYSHYERNKSLYINRPDMSLSTAENILRMLRPDKKFTKLEALVLDIALVLHMEHGGAYAIIITAKKTLVKGIVPDKCLFMLTLHHLNDFLIFFIYFFRSSTYIFCRFRKDTDRYVRSSYPLRW